MPLPELANEPLGLKRAAHLLRRATFGATVEQIRSFAEQFPTEAVANLFTNDLPSPDPPIDPQTGQNWIANTTSGANSMESMLQEYIKRWIVAQMLSVGVESTMSLSYSVREKIVFFLHSHFTTIQSRVNNSHWLFFQNQLFRHFAFDGENTSPDKNFIELTVKISIDNAMLQLLDGNLNVKGSPNENYARELLELFSIGRGLEGNLPSDPTEAGDYVMFTEQDVQSAARVLSGWQVDNTYETIDPDTNIHRGKVKGSPANASAHDNGVKQFSFRFADAVISPNPLLLNGGNATEESALDEIRQLITLIYSRREAAKNICWKLYRFFVYAPHSPEESAIIDQNVIEVMADTFIANNFKIQPVLENLFRSQHFYESGTAVQDDNFGGIIKSPLDLIIGTVRLFQIPIPTMDEDVDEFYSKTSYIVEQLDRQGMKFYEPFDVAGYEAYHQFPIYHRSWITPNFLARRYDFLHSVTTLNSGGMFSINVLDFVKNNFQETVAQDARQLIPALAEILFPIADGLTFNEDEDDESTLTIARLNYFKQRLLQQFDETYWTNRWLANAGDLREQLEFLFNAMMQSPEYQLA